MTQLLKTLLLCSLIAAPMANACDLCAIYRAVEAQESKPGFYVGGFEQYTHFGTLQFNGDKVHDPASQYLDSFVTQGVAGYQVNEKFSLQANVPYIHRSFKRPEGFRIDRDTETGLGDTSLIGNYHLCTSIEADTTLLWHVFGGVKFPTGDSSRLREEFEEMEIEGAPPSGIHGHDLALGSGSYDGIVGSSAFWRWKRFFVSAEAQYAIRSEGDFQYQYANDITWCGGPGVYLWLHDKSTMRLLFNASGEYKGKDSFRGEKAQDTAITAVYLGPELQFTWLEKLSAAVGVDLPVLQDNSALQLVPDYRLRAAVTWRF